MLAGPMGGAGEPTGDVTQVYPCRNADASARTYTVEPRDLLRAMRDAEAHGDEIIGVWHSHTPPTRIRRRPMCARPSIRPGSTCS